ncbi:MAG: 50S ribosomal protein L18 [Clostridiaceae bacterium]|jgi:large subunit ribosomal protein L18|nr:50S ribosomal protein L18 [Clostridia bacterium]MBP6161765.1 50S ribosomal protein L18 [Clostridia bacterium]MBP6949984.1 50S ribosomal protein L18 [Clostridia bacterium]NMA36260.1 50S ribosomal protein L18 [Clostridiaceae bacterium]
MIKKEPRNVTRRRRHARVRRHVHGTAERPRLNVFRSTSHIYAQIIDDVTHRTLVAASTLDPAIKSEIKYGGNIEAAKVVGKLIAERALEADIKTVVFDRGGYKYHGRVAALADAAREAGLSF